MSAPKHSALVRNDLGGLELRYFSNAADARAVRAEREWSEPEIIVRAHPAGGFTHARRAAKYGAARVYVGNWPSERAARAALARSTGGAA